LFKFGNYILIHNSAAKNKLRNWILLVKG